jgi:hypothetical protein
VKAEFHNDSENSIFFPAEGRQGDSQMPLGTGFDGEVPADAIIDQSGRKKVSSSTLLLLLVVVLAGIGLYSMRSLATAMAGGGADKGLEETIESFLTSMTGDGARGQGELTVDDAGAVLLDDRIGLQVPLEEVQKNPFVPLPMEQSSTLVEAPIDDGSAGAQERIALAREEAKKLFEAEATKLRLLMVMGGTDPMANISGRVVRLGDTVADERLSVEFHVIEISQGLVVLRGERSDLALVHDIALRLIRD